jgi:hypothetical protein
MRNNTLLSLFLIAILVSNCGNSTRKNAADSGLKQSKPENVKLFFKEYEHDFGKVTEGEKVGYIFTFENKGTEDLIITSATTTCGCTVPKFDKKPVRPGDTGNLEVVFDTSGRNGMQTKTITVKSNASIPVVLLKITAEVVPITNN